MSWIPTHMQPPKRIEETLQHVGFNYVKITQTYPSGRSYVHFECNCHREESEAGIHQFMETVFH